jgi:hypothetical protein
MWKIDPNTNTGIIIYTNIHVSKSGLLQKTKKRRKEWQRVNNTEIHYISEGTRYNDTH